MRRFFSLALCGLSCCSLFASEIEYTYTAEWYDAPVVNGQPTTYSETFSYISSGFYAGGTLNGFIEPSPTPGFSCSPPPAYEFGFRDLCSAATLEQTSTGVVADPLFSGLISSGAWSQPGDSGLGAFFAGVQLDEFGTWTAGDGAITDTLTIADPIAAPEPSPTELLLVGLFVAGLWRIRTRQFWPGIKSR